MTDVQKASKQAEAILSDRNARRATVTLYNTVYNFKRGADGRPVLVYTQYTAIGRKAA